MILLPGFVTTGVIRALTVTPESTEFDKVVRAFSYSFLNYMVFALIYTASKSTLPFLDPSAPLSATIDIVIIGAIALAMGCLVAAYQNNDGHALLRLLRLTYRSSRLDIWHDSLAVGSSKFHVTVTLEDGRRILGWVVHYSDTMEEPALFLRKAAWLVEEEGEIKEIPAANEGILLLPTMKIASVEFLRFAETEIESTEE